MSPADNPHPEDPAPREREAPGAEGPGTDGSGTDGPAPRSPRLEEVAQSAANAFGLLPAGPEDEDRRRTAGGLPQRLHTDPETVERDLIKLVLTIVELLRQLMERTALHRVDKGDLSEDQEERVGMTLMILQDKLAELADQHGLTMDDLNLDLGPLGTLLPRGDG